MTNSTRSIVVTGATGTIGHNVVEAIAARKLPVVAFTRDAAKARALERSGARLALGSFEDQASLDKAFAGASTVVLITPPQAQALGQATRAIEAAVRVKVPRIVRVSAIKASLDGPTENTRQHGEVEARLRASGLAHVVLRPHTFMQNLLASLPALKHDGTLYFGVGDARVGMIDTRDVADATAALASTPQFDGQVFELTGPQSLDYHAVAHALTRALGKTITYQPVPPEAVSDAMRRFGADEWVARIVREYCVAYSKGWGDFTTDSVLRLTSHAPRTIDQFASEVLRPAW